MTEKPLVLIPGKIHPRVIERLQGKVDLLQLDHPDAFKPAETDVTRIVAAAFGGRFPSALMDQLPNLKIVANFGVGYDGIDTSHAKARGILVTNTPDVLDDEVADTTIALLLNTTRRLYAAETYLREGRWEKEGAFALSPLSLRGRHVGMYGLGRIGREIAARLEPFKVKISYHTRTARKDVSYDHYSSLKSLADAVDTLICIVPKTADTHKAVNAEVLSALGPHGIFINVGRGWSVDDEALIGALQKGTIAAAGLDVFYDEPKVPAPLLQLPNVSLLPHVASASVDTRNAMADLVADNVLNYLEKGAPLTPVPETPFK